ncbi:tetratricopeptide repeat protein [uncultured Microbulbifer sp.]|uniref:tetratricopeptide repeat protein n=1 Tax=uncultured Microbulbifer sp. TaxID=348147 RepID=UPI002631BB01|nr:tetratricopeptide repeat protein [uncultured Microbulbifer sp.]
MLTGTVILSRPVAEKDLPNIDILAINRDMHLLLDSVDGATKSARLNTLMEKLQDQNFTLLYDADATLNASTVFVEQRGNCMAFSVFMVAMARELGINAQFNEVLVPETWSLKNKQTYVYQHINVIADLDIEQRMLDFNFVEYQPIYRQTTLEDTDAFARFYSNLSMDFLSDQKYTDAFLYIRKALALSPQSADLWNNLGAVYRAAGHPDHAASAYKVSLVIDGTNTMALSNLERILTEEGDWQSTNIISEHLQRYREQNPYYWYGNALAAYKQGHYELAIDDIKAAISLEKNDHRFHFLLGLLRFKSGNYGYRGHFQQALTLSVADRDQGRYRQKLEILGLEDIRPTRQHKAARFWDRRNWWSRLVR